MFHAQIIRNGKPVAETQYPVADLYAAAQWAHRMGWNVDSFNNRSGNLSSDCGTLKATLRIFSA